MQLNARRSLIAGVVAVTVGWLAVACGTTTADTASSSAAGAELGRSLATSTGCIACHSVTGAPGIGPTWFAVFGSEGTLDDGTTILIDEAYLRESIVNPDAKIVKGYAAKLMPPTYGESLSDEQITGLIEYIKTIK